MNKKRILVFDTETTGKPKNYKPAEEDINNYPSVVQFGAQLIEVDIDNVNDTKILYAFQSYVKPERNGKLITIEKEAQAIHNISIEDCWKGDDIWNIALLFQGLCNSAEFIVCHNYTFDRNVMVSELLRLGIRPKYARGCKVFCTMKYSTDIMQLPSTYPNQFKFPKLEQLFKYTTGVDMNDMFKAHDALEDTQATTIALLKLIEQQPELAKWFKGEIESIYK